MNDAAEISQSDASTPSAIRAPDWESLESDLTCPRCDYNLRMLTLPRCPECGLTFDWQALIAAAERERECPIFEYQWRRRPIRSALYTVWLAVQPWWLWRLVKLEFDPRMGPLLVLTSLAFVQAFLIGALMAGAWQAAANYKFGGPTSFAAYMRYTVSWSALSLILQTQLAPLLIVLAAIAVYRLTLVRFRIRFVHLARIAALAWIGWLWSALLVHIPVQAVAITLLLTTPARVRYVPAWTDAAIQALAFAVYLVSLRMAFRHYLRLSRAWLAATASMILATVAITVFTVAYTVYGRRRTFGDSLAPLDEWIPGLQWLILRVLAA